MASPDRADGLGGLSPHTRGNPKETRQWVVEEGSIPAHAGEPVKGLEMLWDFGVYPRTRGGTSFAAAPP